MEIPGILIVLVLAFVAYLIYDHHRHPKVQCPECKGSGRKTSSWNKKAWGSCLRCANTGYVDR